MAIVIRSNNPFAAITKGYIPGAKYVYVKPVTLQKSPTGEKVFMHTESSGAYTVSHPDSSKSGAVSPGPGVAAIGNTTAVSSVAPQPSDGGGGYNLVLPPAFSQALSLETTLLNSMLAMLSPWQATGSVSAGGGGGGGESVVQDWLSSILGVGVSDSSFLTDIQSLVSGLPQQQGTGADTFMSDIQGLLSALPSGESTQGDTFMQDMMALMPVQQFQEGGSFYDEISALMSTAPAVDFSQPSDNEFYDSYYYYKAQMDTESFLSDYY